MTIEINVDRLTRTHPYSLKPFDVVTMGTMNAKNAYIFKYHLISKGLGKSASNERVYKPITAEMLSKIKRKATFFWCVNQVFQNITTGEIQVRSSKAIVMKLDRIARGKKKEASRLFLVF
tara:strand:+ start:952 stop:1311 length:360 start_codon:yes stop_codon:yes gene_type:complete